MAKKINEKTSGISLAGFQPRTAATEQKSLTLATVPAVKESSKSYTGAGIFMSAITGKDEISKELVTVQAQLDEANKTVAEFHDAKIVRLVNAGVIRQSHWANRSEESLRSKGFVQLKSEIENAGGNVQPIKVRPISDSVYQFEIVYGHRRHRACLELGLPVLALIDAINDVDLFVAMDRENRLRADLRPYEQGVMYARALDEGLFPSLRKLADALGVDVGNASKAVSLARLPSAVLTAFASPLDLQQAWATSLSIALQKHPDQVLERARELSSASPKLEAVSVYKALVEGGVVSNNTPERRVVVQGTDGKSGTIDFNVKKNTFSINLVGLGIDQISKIEKIVGSLLN